MGPASPPCGGGRASASFPTGWSFNTADTFDWFAAVQALRLDGIAGQIQCPAFVGDGPADRFFAGQPKKLADAIGANATYHRFGEELSADLHCQVGANVELARATLDWFLDVVGAPPAR